MYTFTEVVKTNPIKPNFKPSPSPPQKHPQFPRFFLILDNSSSKFQRRKPEILHPRIGPEQLDLQKICVVISSLICNIWRSLISFWLLSVLKGLSDGD